MKKILDDYQQDIEDFGFGPYAIDFSYMSEKKIRYICEAMRKYNTENGIEPRIY